MSVPWCKIFIPDRPIDSNAIFCIGFKICFAPAIALTAPHERTATHMITAKPVKSFCLRIRIVFITCPEMKISFIQRIISFQKRIISDHLLCSLATVRILPYGFIGLLIIFSVLNIKASFKHNNLKPFFSKLLSCPATTNTRANYDRIKCVVVCHIIVYRLWFIVYRYWLPSPASSIQHPVSSIQHPASSATHHTFLLHLSALQVSLHLFYLLE